MLEFVVALKCIPIEIHFASFNESSYLDPEWADWDNGYKRVGFSGWYEGFEEECICFIGNGNKRMDDVLIFCDNKQFVLIKKTS